VKNNLILVLIVSFAFSGFESGLKMFGGSAGLSKNLEDESSQLILAPKMGGFVSDNILMEGGLTYLRDKVCDWTGCITQDEIILGIGIKFFLEKLYLGVEYAPGVESFMTTPSGTSFVGMLNSVYDLSDTEEEILIWKVGTLTPIAENIYLDIALNYQTIMNSEHDGIVNYSLGLSYFWRDED
tara:strand:+ start:138 stop:686 length:549 start_codon:yes stop_codon:yes gene_type:complete